MNNLKQLREIYGVTQEEIAVALGVNRVTVANWENGNSVASSGNQEKLSIYYGIGPEYFYEKNLDEVVRQMVIDSAVKAQEVIAKSKGNRSKEDDFHRMFENLTFEKAMKQYMFSMKMMLATADNGALDKLKVASQINDKMGERLKAIIDVREREVASGGPTLFDLIEKIEKRE